MFVLARRVRILDGPLAGGRTQIEVINHQGVLAQLANTIAATGANIQGISTEEKDARVYQVNLLITTRSRIHLADVMRKIRVMPDVLRVSRSRQ